MQAPGDARPASLSERVRRRFAAARPDNLIVYLGFLAVVVFFAVSLQDRGFLTADNFANIARQTAMVSIMAFGMTFVLSAGEIDLSIGSIVGHLGMVVAMLLREDATSSSPSPAPWPWASLIGLVNGLLTTRCASPRSWSRSGCSASWPAWPACTTDLEAVPVMDETYAFLFGSGIDRARARCCSCGRRPSWSVFHMLFRRTPFGRQVLATGGNKIAAGFSGIKTDRIKIAA